MIIPPSSFQPHPLFDSTRFIFFDRYIIQSQFVACCLFHSDSSNEVHWNYQNHKVVDKKMIQIRHFVDRNRAIRQIKIVKIVAMSICRAHKIEVMQKKTAELYSNAGPFLVLKNNYNFVDIWFVSVENMTLLTYTVELSEFKRELLMWRVPLSVDGKKIIHFRSPELRLKLLEQNCEFRNMLWSFCAAVILN